MDEAKVSARRWLQIRIRSWLVLAAVLAVPLAVYGQSIEQWWRTPKRSRETTSLCSTPPLTRIVIQEEDEEKLGIDLGP
jgi:hypothetical protein